MKLVTVVGARPQFIKAAAVEASLRHEPRGLESVMVHTGQHYDFDMSRVFFEQLGIPVPKYDLNIGSGSHGQQTGRMLEAIEHVLLEEHPSAVLVYGDTNSTLAGALAAVKLHIPVAHVEAGLRSYNRRMPEEINRVLTDEVSRWLFCPGEDAVRNLEREGIRDGVTVTGDVMYELLVHYANRCPLPTEIAATAENRPFVLATIHRAENTDAPDRLEAIFWALGGISQRCDVFLPMHPRTREAVRRRGFAVPTGLHILDPMGYHEMLGAQRSAALVVTDSGGVQKEAYWLGVPCVTVRDETEWTETLESNRNIVTGAVPERIASAAASQLDRGRLPPPTVAHPNAASRILHTLETELA
jgi:UDP-GlcNAc3NAcA epimerase